MFLLVSLNICFGCLKEPSNCDRSFEHPLHYHVFVEEKADFKLPPFLQAWVKPKSDGFF